MSAVKAGATVTVGRYEVLPASYHFFLEQLKNYWHFRQSNTKRDQGQDAGSPHGVLVAGEQVDLRMYAAPLGHRASLVRNSWRRIVRHQSEGSKGQEHGMDV